MSKKMRKITILLLSIVLVVAFTSTLLTVAFADGEGESVAPQERVYDANFDRMLEDASGDSATTAYRAVSWNAGQCDDLNDPIFKIGSPKISAGFNTLSIELRSPDSSVKLDDLTIALRIANDDAIALANSYKLTDDAIEGAVSLSKGSEIGSEWATLTLDFTQSEVQVNGSAFDTTKPDALLGFHLYANNGQAGKLDIAKVYVSSASGDTILENFAGVKDCWWDNSEAGCFTDIPRCIEITSSKEIKSAVATSNNVDEVYSAIVLKIAGNGNVSVAPIAEDGTVGTAVAYSNLKDLAGTAVASLDNNYRNAVISLESLGLKKIQGVKIIVEDGQVNVAQAFFTNVETVVPDRMFPTIDVDSIAYLSQFGFEYTPDADYNKAVEDCASFNCDYILSYSNEKPVITNGHVVLTDKGNEFSNIKIRSKTASEGRDLLVIKYVTKNGATLDNFRFAVIKSDPDANTEVVYANQMKAGVALPSLSDKNPYSDGNYSYLVVDLEKSFEVVEISGVDMYYSGAGELLIDEIFYCNKVRPSLDTDSKIVYDSFDVLPAEDSGYYWTRITDSASISIEDGALKIDVPSTPICVGGAKPTNNKDAKHAYMVIRMKSENLTMDTFRIEWLDGKQSFANAGGFVTLDGKDFVLTDEYQDFVIDLDASGISREIEGFTLWLGGWNPEAGSLYIDEIYFTDLAIPAKESYEASASLTHNEEPYTYVGGGDFINTNGYRYMKVDITALNTLSLEGIRFELKGPDKLLWSGSDFTVATPVVLGDGEEATLRTQSFIFDLNGIENVTQFHIHMNAINVDSSFKAEVTYFDYIPYPASVELPRNDDSKPEISVTIPETGKAGEEINIIADAIDNYGEANVEYEVTLNGNAIEVVDGKFTPNAAGTYTIKIKVTDAEGHVTEHTSTIVVSEATSGDPVIPVDPTVPSDDNGGLSTGAIVGIVIGAIALIAIIVFAVISIKKKKNA